MYHIFPHYLINGTAIGGVEGGGGEVTEQVMCVLISSTNSIRKFSHSKKHSTRCSHKRTWGFTQSTNFSCEIFV